MATLPSDFLGQKARALRERTGEKPGQFAAAIEISRSHLDNVEHERVSPSVETAWRIANRLGVHLKELLLHGDLGLAVEAAEADTTDYPTAVGAQPTAQSTAEDAPAEARTAQAGAA